MRMFSHHHDAMKASHCWAARGAGGITGRRGAPFAVIDPNSCAASTSSVDAIPIALAKLPDLQVAGGTEGELLQEPVRCHVTHVSCGMRLIEQCP